MEHFEQRDYEQCKLEPLSEHHPHILVGLTIVGGELEKNHS